MKIIMTILSILFLLIMVTGTVIYLSASKETTKATKTVKVNNEYEYTFGPYSCSGKDITIHLSYSVNKLAGANSIKKLQVTFGPSLTLQQLYVFTDIIQKQTTEDLSYGGATEQYVAKNYKGVVLPSQEELIDRGINPTYNAKGAITLGTDSNVSMQELEEFAQCFSVHKKEIYDDIANKKNNLPFYIWFNKAYLIK